MHIAVRYRQKFGSYKLKKVCGRNLDFHENEHTHASNITNSLGQKNYNE